MCRVMVVDDSLFMRTVLRSIMSQAGYDVIAEATDGVEAIHRYGLFEPDLTTLDLTMPVMGGLEALQNIKAIHPNARIIVVSAMGQESIIKKAIISGAAGFIVKPFKTDKVIRELSTVMRGM